MAWWNKIFGASEPAGQTKIRLISDTGDWYAPWGGNLYKSDIVRAAIRPKVKAMGKLQATHIREGPDGLKVNPDFYMKRLLQEPNPYSTGQMFMERMITQLELNNNSFALIYRNADGLPVQLYPIFASSVEAVRKEGSELHLKFWLPRGKVLIVPYSDVIHLRDDYNENDIFGSPKSDALKPLMEIINASDRSIVNAVKNSAIIRWIMKFNTILRKEDRDMAVEEFVETFLSSENEGGAAYSDPRYDLEQVKREQFVPATPQQEKAIQRIYSFFGTNDKIVQAKYDENDWLAYYESEIEPCALQASGEFTRKLFTPRERGFGNRITFDSMDMSFASMQTKLNLVQMVDRRSLTPNEWRRVMNLPPLEGGDEPILRLDTQTVRDTDK